MHAVGCAAVARGEDSGEDGLAVGLGDGRVVVVVMMTVVERGRRRGGRDDVRQLLVEEQGTLDGALFDVVWMCKESGETDWQNRGRCRGAEVVNDGEGGERGRARAYLCRRGPGRIHASDANDGDEIEVCVVSVFV